MRSARNRFITRTRPSSRISARIKVNDGDGVKGYPYYLDLDAAPLFSSVITPPRFAFSASIEDALFFGILLSQQETPAGGNLKTR